MKISVRINKSFTSFFSQRFRRTRESALGANVQLQSANTLLKHHVSQYIFTHFNAMTRDLFPFNHVIRCFKFADHSDLFIANRSNADKESVCGNEIFTTKDDASITT